MHLFQQVTAADDGLSAVFMAQTQPRPGCINNTVAGLSGQMPFIVFNSCQSDRSKGVVVMQGGRYDAASPVDSGDDLRNV
jgi:hypothetical protein